MSENARRVSSAITVAWWSRNHRDGGPRTASRYQLGDSGYSGVFHKGLLMACLRTPMTSPYWATLLKLSLLFISAPCHVPSGGSRKRPVLSIAHVQNYLHTATPCSGAHSYRRFKLHSTYEGVGQMGNFNTASGPLQTALPGQRT